MKLFNIIPDNLFSILASPNKEIYLDALFVLRRAYKQEMFIAKDHLVTMLIADLEDKMMDLEFEAEEEIQENNLSSLAHFLVRKLDLTGWIDLEYHSGSFEEYVTLYDYSIKILNALYELMDNTPGEYNSFVYSTYSSLRTADEEKNDYIYNALSEAYKNTGDLQDALKSLLNNIRQYHQTLNEQSEIKEILEGHFDRFKELVGDKIYHPLKTFDSVPRFKAPILSILRNWQYDSEIKELLVDSALVRKHYGNRDDALENITKMIGEIIDVFEKIDQLIKEIDRKNALYTRASVEKMQYLLNTDRSVKGKLVEILKQAAGCSEVKKQDLYQRMGEIVNLFPQGYIDIHSLYSRGKRRVRVEGEPLKITEQVDEEALLREFDDFKAMAKKSFTTKKVMAFMQQQFRDRQIIETKDLNIQNDDDFIMLILGTLKHDEQGTFYNVDFIEGYKFINGYRVPQMKLTRKV